MTDKTQGQCRTDGRCQYAIDSGAEGMGHCPKGKCIMPAQQQEHVAYASAWFALVMNAAAELEDASNCLRDEDAKRVAISGAKYYRDAAKNLYTSPQSKPWVGLVHEETHEAIGTAGVDLLELAKMWSDNKIHVYQFDNEARKIIEVVLRRASAKLREKNT